MAKSATDDDNEDKPLDPAVERVRRKLVRFVALNLGLLFLALMAVVAALVYKSRTAAPPPAVAAGPEIPAPAGESVERRLAVPAGSRLVSHALAGDRLTLELEAADGSRSLLVYDLATGGIVARIALVPE